MTRRQLPEANVNPAAAPWARQVAQRLMAAEATNDTQDSAIRDLRRAVVANMRRTSPYWAIGPSAYGRADYDRYHTSPVPDWRFLFADQLQIKGGFAESGLLKMTGNALTYFSSNSVEYPFGLYPTNGAEPNATNARTKADASILFYNNDVILMAPGVKDPQFDTWPAANQNPPTQGSRVDVGSALELRSWTMNTSSRVRMGGARFSIYLQTGQGDINQPFAGTHGSESEVFRVSNDSSVGNGSPYVRSSAVRATSLTGTGVRQVLVGTDGTLGIATVANGQAPVINDATTSTTSVWSSSKTDTQKADRSEVEDLPDFTLALENALA